MSQRLEDLLRQVVELREGRVRRAEEANAHGQDAVSDDDLDVLRIELLYDRIALKRHMAGGE